MPLHLLLGLRTSLTPSLALHRRRTSPGMSLKYRHCSFAFQIGPSVNQKPVQSFSTAAPLSISFSISGDFTSTAFVESFILFFAPPEYPSSSGGRMRSALVQPTLRFLTLSLRRTICLAQSRVKLCAFRGEVFK